MCVCVHIGSCKDNNHWILESRVIRQWSTTPETEEAIVSCKDSS